MTNVQKEGLCKAVNAAWEVDQTRDSFYAKHMATRAPAFRNHLFSVGRVTFEAHKNLMPCVLFARAGEVRVFGEGHDISAPIIRCRTDRLHTVVVGEGGAEILYLDGVQSEAGLADFSELDTRFAGIPDAVKAGDYAAIDRFRHDLAPTAPEPDIEVLKIIEVLYAAPMERLTQTQLSERLGLERTQALKHFKVNTGQTFRKFKMWTALVATVHRIMSGQKIGSAGIDSGFSDAAHVARTARDIFGITPTNGTGALSGFRTV